MNTKKPASWSITFMLKNILSEREKHFFSFLYQIYGQSRYND